HRQSITTASCYHRPPRPNTSDNAGACRRVSPQSMVFRKANRASRSKSFQLAMVFKLPTTWQVIRELDTIMPLNYGWEHLKRLELRIMNLRLAVGVVRDTATNNTPKLQTTQTTSSRATELLGKCQRLVNRLATNKPNATPSAENGNPLLSSLPPTTPLDTRRSRSATLKIRPKQSKVASSRHLGLSDLDTEPEDEFILKQLGYQLAPRKQRINCENSIDIYVDSDDRVSQSLRSTFMNSFLCATQHKCMFLPKVLFLNRDVDELARFLVIVSMFCFLMLPRRYQQYS
ncbi:hypothetical protein AHF37_02557, partial [Paragonimus kellicotti]